MSGTIDVSQKYWAPEIVLSKQIMCSKKTHRKFLAHNLVQIIIGQGKKYVKNRLPVQTLFVWQHQDTSRQFPEKYLEDTFLRSPSRKKNIPIIELIVFISTGSDTRFQRKKLV